MATATNIWKQCIFIVFIISGVSCVRTWISPRKTVVRPGDSLFVTCRTPPGFTLDSCQFFISGTPAINFSLGLDSEVTEGYRYYGRRLNEGKCSINLLEVAGGCPSLSKIVTITCATKVTGHGWSISYMSALISNVQTFPLTMDRTRTVVEPASNVSILCTTLGIPLRSCFFEGKHLGRLDLSQGPVQPPLWVGDVRVDYFGQGLEEGDCGVTLSGVRDDWSGLVWCAAKSELGSWGYDYTALVVKKPPSTLDFKVNSPSVKLGETLNATCIVKGFRETVQLYWEPPFDENITDVYSDSLFEAKFDFEEQVIAQRSVKTTVDTDHRRNVRCTARYNETNELSAHQQVKVRFCGKRNFKNVKPLIFGGIEAMSGEFPWHVALYLKTNGTHQYQCGGSLISTKHFITAAHCMWDKSLNRPQNASQYGAVLGKFHSSWGSDEQVQRFDIAQVELHKDYRDYGRQYEDDIAILHLAGEAVFSREVHPICMDWKHALEDDMLVDGKFGVVPGFGLTEHSRVSDTLRYVEIPYMDVDVCRTVVPGDFSRFLVPYKFCAGYVNQSMAVCGGDSGGGLVYESSTSNYYLMGLVSVAPTAVNSRCNAEQIALFTKVSEYLTWIQEVLDKDDAVNVLESTV